jgi:RNA polymerase sigma-70 factor (ECF subfamily)
LVAAGRGPADSEDVVQEALLAMHLKRDTWDETQPIEPWLRAIARYKLVDHLRRRGFHDHLDIDDYADVVAVTADADAAVDSGALLASLPKRQRRIVEEISLEGRRAAEVAERLGMSEGAVRVTLHRALKALAAAYRRDER